MSDFKLGLAPIKIVPGAKPYCVIIRSSAILFTFYVLCLHHVTTAIFVHMEFKLRLGAILSRIIRSSAIFV